MFIQLTWHLLSRFSQGRNHWLAGHCNSSSVRLRLPPQQCFLGSRFFFTSKAQPPSRVAPTDLFSLPPLLPAFTLWDNVFVPSNRNNNTLCFWWLFKATSCGFLLRHWTYYLPLLVVNTNCLFKIPNLFQINCLTNSHKKMRGKIWIQNTYIYLVTATVRIVLLLFLEWKTRTPPLNSSSFANLLFAVLSTHWVLTNGIVWAVVVAATEQSVWPHTHTFPYAAFRNAFIFQR